VQADWRSVGADVTLVPEEAQIAYSDYRSRDFQMADAAWIADYNDPMTFLFLMKSNTGAQNYSNYANPAYDALLNKADQESDLIKRGAYLAQAEHMALEDATIAPIFHYVSKNLVSPRITGWVDNLADWSSGVPLFVVGTARPELLDRRPGWGGGKLNATTLALSPLADVEAAQIISRVLEQALLSADTQQLLLERAGGNDGGLDGQELSLRPEDDRDQGRSDRHLDKQRQLHPHREGRRARRPQGRPRRQRLDQVRQARHLPLLVHAAPARHAR